MPRPRWLVIFTLILDCDEISRRFQSQPTTPAEWSLFRWCDRTISQIPSIADEANWGSNMRIPNPFDPNREDVKPVFHALFGKI